MSVTSALWPHGFMSVTSVPWPPQLQLTKPSSVPPPSVGGGGSPHPPRQQQQQPQQPRAARVPSGPLKPEQVAKLLSELDVVRKNMDVMNEIMSEQEPGRESADDAQLLDVSGVLFLLVQIFVRTTMHFVFWIFVQLWIVT